jgi:hypothetical protein
MKSVTLAALLLAGVSSAAFAQQAPAPADVPKHKCEPKPQLPMRTMMGDPNTRKRFQKEIEEYKNCMKAFADERATAAKAHTDAGNAAINEYNDTMKALQDAQSQR